MLNMIETKKRHGNESVDHPRRGLGFRRGVSTCRVVDACIARFFLASFPGVVCSQ